MIINFERGSKMSSRAITIYIYLLDEGTDTWRPTQAIDLGNGRYKVLPTGNYDLEDEVWEFLPGTIVRCEPRAFRDGEFPVAVEQVG